MTKAEAIRWLIGHGWGFGAPTPILMKGRSNQCGRCLRWLPATIANLTTTQRVYLCAECRVNRTKPEDMPQHVPTKFTDFLRAWRKQLSDAEKAKRKAEREAAKVGSTRKARPKKAGVPAALRAAATEAGVPADAATATDQVPVV